MTAEVQILVEGYAEEKTCPTITLVKDGDLIMVVDPGVLESQQVLIDALQKEGLAVSDVNIVCITHSHLDHYRNIGMFANAKALDFFGVWEKQSVEDWKEQFSENIQILKTPGHDHTSITLFVKTDNGLVAICGDVFWKEDFPENDIYALDAEKLKESRSVVLRLADWIIPGHGKMYSAKKSQAENTKEKTAIEKKKELKNIMKCKKCGRLLNKKNKCLCRTWLCFKCCECGLDCDLCACSQER
jgi:glyoxylase-like metal-dependent hydrolase (beta-lactamase superfamily II)